MSTSSWHFVLHNDHRPHTWTWRRMRSDGTIEQTSEPLLGFGRAVGHAVDNGFRPKQDPWVVIAGRTYTHFRAGERAVVIPPDTGSALPERKQAARLPLLRTLHSSPQPQPAAFTALALAEVETLPEVQTRPVMHGARRMVTRQTLSLLIALEMGKYPECKGCEQWQIERTATSADECNWEFRAAAELVTSGCFDRIVPFVTALKDTCNLQDRG